jgi:hypothetical protein
VHKDRCQYRQPQADLTRNDINSCKGTEKQCSGGGGGNLTQETRVKLLHDEDSRDLYS